VALSDAVQAKEYDIMSAVFGPAGNADSFPYKSSVDAPKWIAAQGLDVYEYQCGKGVNVREETAQKLGAAAREAGIALSLHAPYFINLANPDPESLQKTIGYIVSACEAAEWMGARRVVIHSGALMKRTRREAMEIAIPSLKAVIAACDGAGYGHIALCPETMGKINQLGDLDEVLELCTLDERLIPTVDFGHLYARTLGELEGHEACVKMLDRIQEVLGENRARTFHSHFSKIQFTPNGGEKMHLTFQQEDFGPDPAPLMAEVARRNWSPTFICESAGTQAEDALTMKRMYMEARS
jgi:deoxyribonuclease-4